MGGTDRSAGPGQLGWHQPVDEPRSDRIDVVPEWVDAEKLRFNGQQSFGTDAFLLDVQWYRHFRHHAPEEVRAVVHPLLLARSMLKRPLDTVDRWVIDIPETREDRARENYPRLMAHLAAQVRADRETNVAKEVERNVVRAAQPVPLRPLEHHVASLRTWWRLGGRRQDMLVLVRGLSRYLVTPKASGAANGIFTFVSPAVRANDSLDVYALSDDYSFGVLTSRVYQHWVRAQRGAARGWPSFPWPQAPTASGIAVVAELSAEVLQVRQEQFAEGVSLRRQHHSDRSRRPVQLCRVLTELDHAVLDAYGFSRTRSVVSQLSALRRDLAAGTTPSTGPGGRRPEAWASSYRLLPRT